MNSFTEKINLKLLWDVLLENNPSLKSESQEYKQRVAHTFSNTVKQFKDRYEGVSSVDLLSLNKMFLMHMSNIVQQQRMPYKQHEIMEQRQQQFNNRLIQKQQEFEDLLTVPKPQVPNFAVDLSNDKKINQDDMKALLEEMDRQRNYDRDIQLPPNPNTLMKPQETNIKTEKINSGYDAPQQYQYHNTGQKVKYIQIDSQNLSPTVVKDDIITLPPQKNLSWNDANLTQTFYYDGSGETPAPSVPNMTLHIGDNETQNGVNIFAKLKPIETESKEASISDRLDKIERKLDAILVRINATIPSVHSQYDDSNP